MKAGDIVEEAKKQAFPHIGPDSISDAALLSTLSTQDERVVHQVSQIAPDMLGLQVDRVEIDSDKNHRGYRLKASPMYRDFKYIDDDDDIEEITLVRREDLESVPSHPAGAVTGDDVFTAGFFYPADPQGKRWAGDEERGYYKGDGDAFSYSYIPQPETLDKLSDELCSPVMSRPVMVTELVLQILLGQPGVPETRLEAAVQATNRAWSTFMMQVYKHIKLTKGRRSGGSMHPIHRDLYNI